MGFGDRLKLGLSKYLSVPTQNRLAYSNSSQKRTSSIDVNEMKEMMTGFSQPVFGPEISTVGAYSREGYTSRTFDTPTTKFADQVYYVRRDEDIQHALHVLSSRVTGGAHYWKSEIEEITNKMTQFSKDIDFDWIDTIIVKELLAYGNSVWKPRLGINNIRNKEDIMQVPISSFVRVWWDRQRRPYKYEFRGSEYQGYHNDGEIIHLSWNPINSSIFGTGFMDSLIAQKDFIDQTPSGERRKTLMSLMDRKYSIAMLTHLSARRYSPHNVYQAPAASDGERDQLRSDLADFETGEDVVVGSKVTVTELGTSSRAYNPEQFQDTVQGQILKATNDFSGKQGSESSHQYANAETSNEIDDIGLASFPLAVSTQIIEKLFQPWYEQNGGSFDPCYGGGMIAIPWKEANPVLEFGRIQKKDIDPETQIKLIEMGIQSGAIPDPTEQRQLLEDAGLGLRKEFTESLVAQYNPMQPQPQGPSFDTYNADQGLRPQDDPNYMQSNQFFDPRSDATFGQQNPNVSPQPSQAGLNFTVPGISKEKFENTFDNLEIDDVNVLASNPSNEIEKRERLADLEEKEIKNETRKRVLETIKKLEGRSE